jgi:hypothetical protein
MRKARKAAGHPSVVFVSGPPQVSRVLSITKLDALWLQCPDLPAAKAALEAVAAKEH